MKLTLFTSKIHRNQLCTQAHTIDLEEFGCRCGKCQFCLVLSHSTLKTGSHDTPDDSRLDSDQVSLFDIYSGGGCRPFHNDGV